MGDRFQDTINRPGHAGSPAETVFVRLYNTYENVPPLDEVDLSGDTFHVVAEVGLTGPTFAQSLDALTPLWKAAIHAFMAVVEEFGLQTVSRFELQVYNLEYEGSATHRIETATIRQYLNDRIGPTGVLRTCENISDTMSVSEMEEYRANRAVNSVGGRCAE